MTAGLARRVPAAAGLLGAVIGLVAAWRVVTLATDPLAQPAVHLKRAEQALADGRVEEAEAHARAALSAAPLDGRPYRVLAQLAGSAGDTAAARRLVQSAVRHAPRDVAARAMAAQHAIARNDWPAALAHYDRLLRVRPQLQPQVFPLLGAMAGPPEVRAAVLEILAAGPPWRVAFLQHFARSAPDPQPLFRELRAVAGITPEESDAYVGRYVADRRWTDAFVAWAEPLSSEEITRLGTPVDGGFEQSALVRPPFSWAIGRVVGVEAGVRRLPDGEGHALRIEFLGRRSAFQHVRQLLLLPEGDYTLRWRQRLQGLETARGLRWTMTCADEPQSRILATTAVTGSSPWVSLATPFSVPARCPAQWLVLELEARIAAETLAVGAAWFDDVRVVGARDS